MARKSYIQIDGVLYEKGTEPLRGTGSRSAMVAGDLPDFVSPIDGSVVKGRAGLREHCKRHNVVPTADLKGLPTTRPLQVSPRSERVEDIRRAMSQQGYL